MLLCAWALSWFIKRDYVSSEHSEVWSTLNAQEQTYVLLINHDSWKVVGQIRRELSRNEAHSFAYLMQQEDFIVLQKEGGAKLKDLRAQG